MRRALPPPEDTTLPPGTTQGYAVRPGTVIVCRDGRVALELRAPGLQELPGELRIVLGAGETFVAEDAGWVRCTALGAARVLRVQPARRTAWPAFAVRWGARLRAFAAWTPSAGPRRVSRS